MIVVDRISKSHDGQVVLDDLSFEIEDGAFTALLGATGAGKTTLLRIMAGIEQADAGRIFYNGEDVTKLPVQQRPVAMVYQQFINYPSFTVYDNIASPLRVARVKTREEIDDTVRELAELLGLTEALNRYPQEISGGQCQRTAIARALAKEARYLFLDEPLANLDLKLREELRTELKALFLDRGTIIYATPDPIDALSMASQTGFMHQGQLVQFGPTREVYEQPASSVVGAGFGHPPMNLLRGTVGGENGPRRLVISPGLQVPLSEAWPVDLGRELLLGIRPHHLQLQAQGAALRFQAEVELAEVSGSDTEIQLVHEGQALVLLVDELLLIEPGETVEVGFDPERIYLFDGETGQAIQRRGG